MNRPRPASRLRAEGLLMGALRHPDNLAGLSPSGWTNVIRAARSAGLLGRLGSRLGAAGVTDQIPAAPRAHLMSAQILAGAQHAEVRREVHQIWRTLQPLGVPVVLLKGAAYNLAGVSAAAGRMFNDIDILVPKADLPEVEAALMLDGWATTHHSAYDQHYYRKWMHELPPMQHVQRGTVIDVHHAILPDTARLKPASKKLLEAISPVTGMPGLYVLGPADMVLHSMAHLFCNEEFSHGLRDLTDIDALLREFGKRSGFWDELAMRAADLGLQRPLYYGLQQCAALLECPIPGATKQKVAAAAPPAPLRQLMDRLWRKVLAATPPGSGGRPGSMADLLLLIRAHWLRMPLWLLGFHLCAKLFRGGETVPVKTP